jgi:hypothetical protein
LVGLRDGLTVWKAKVGVPGDLTYPSTAASSSLGTL